MSRQRMGNVLSLPDIQSFQASVGDVATLSLSELLSFWRTLDTADPAATAGEIRGFIADLVDGYQPVAAEVGAGFYDDARDAAGAAGRFTADLAQVPAVDRLQRLVGWAVTPLFQRGTVTDTGVLSTEASDQAVLSRLTAGTQQVVADGARDTVELNTERDPAKPRFARHASANACAFCALLATRGARYRSEQTAGGKYHAHCHCVAVPVFDGDGYQSAPYVESWSKAYRHATRELGGASDVNAVLAKMRVTLGAA